MNLDEIRDRYDELDNLINTVDYLIKESQSKDVKGDLEFLKFNYLDEKEMLEEKISELEEQEERELSREFDRVRI